MAEERKNIGPVSRRVWKGKGKIEELDSSTAGRGAQSETTGPKVLTIDEVPGGSATPAQGPVNIITPVVNSQNESSSSQGEAIKEAAEVLERTSSMAEERKNIVPVSRRVWKGKGKVEELDSSTAGRGAKSETTGPKVLTVNEVAESSTSPAQDPANIITPVVNSQNESSSSQGEAMKDVDEILDREASKEKWRNIVNDIKRKLKKSDDEEEESTERGATSETGHEVPASSTPVQDPVDINLQNASTSHQGELPRDQPVESNFLYRTSMEEKWKNIVKEVLPGEAAVSLEAVPTELMVQLLKVADKFQGSVNRPAETDQDDVSENSSSLFCCCCLPSDCCR